MYRSTPSKGTAPHENQGVFEEKLCLNFKKDKAGVARSCDQKKGTATSNKVSAHTLTTLEK